MYQYFEPNIVAILDEPVATAKLVDEPALEGVKAPLGEKLA